MTAQSHPDSREATRTISKTHTISVLVENSPGVLARIAGLFSRRGYNIDSLAVGPTENEKISRMTIVINVEDHALEQVVSQLDKLVNVISITELNPVASVQRELLLVKVTTDEKTRSQVLETVRQHGRGECAGRDDHRCAIARVARVCHLRHPGRRGVDRPERQLCRHVAGDAGPVS